MFAFKKSFRDRLSAGKRHDSDERRNHLSVGKSAMNGKHSVGNHSVGNHSVGNHSVGNHSVGNQSVGNQSVGNHSVGNQPVGNHSVGNKSIGNHSAGNQPVGNHSVGNKSIGNHSVGNQPVGNHSVGNKSIGNQSVGNHSVGNHAVENRSIRHVNGPTRHGEHDMPPGSQNIPNGICKVNKASIGNDEMVFKERRVANSNHVTPTIIIGDGNTPEDIGQDHGATSLDIPYTEEGVTSLDIPKREERATSLNKPDREEGATSLDIPDREEGGTSLDIPDREEVATSLDILNTEEGVTSLDILNREESASEDRQGDGQQRGGNKFQSAVRRHLGKDRLFHLVTTLLKSIEEENNAQKDLIMSFKTARDIRIDIPKAGRSNTDKPKHRRKKMETPLADIIEWKRKQRINALNDHAPVVEEKQPKSEEIVGNLALNANTSEKNTDPPTSPHAVSIDSNNGGPDKEASAKIKSEPNTYKGPVIFRSDPEAEVKVTGGDVKSDLSDTEEVTLHGNKKRNIQRPALTTEKEIVIGHFRNHDENFDLDKLVLDSVLENTCLINQETNITETEDVAQTVDVTETTSNSERTCDAIVSVDSDSEDESQIDIKGKVDILDDSFEIVNTEKTNLNTSKLIDDTHLIECEGDYQFEKFLADNQHVTSSEYSRMPSTMLKPRLNTISEAEHSATSFSSLYGNSSDSIIEIETDKHTLEKLNRHVRINEIKIHENNDILPDKNAYKVNTRSGSDDELKHSDGIGVHMPNAATLSNPRRMLCIDLLGVYESNEDLQRINLGQSERQRKPKVKVANKGGSSNKRFSLTSYSGQRNGHEQLRPRKTLKTLPLFPRSVQLYKPIPRLKSVEYINENEKPTSIENIEIFRSYATRKDSERYRKPDVPLWNSFRTRDTSPLDVHSSKPGIQTSTESLSIPNQSDPGQYMYRRTADGRRYTRKKHRSKTTTEFRLLAVPLKHSSKPFGQTSHVKDPDDNEGRQERVQDLYKTLQQDRAKGGHRHYKYLDLSPRERTVLY